MIQLNNNINKNTKMKTFLNVNNRVIGIATFFLFFMITDYIQAQAGHMHRATRRRTAVVVSSATHSKDQQAAAAQQAQAPAPAPAPVPASVARLPLGTIVQKLPGGCVSLSAGDTEYYQCGADYYRVAYQENNLVYVTTDPPK